MPIDTSLTQEMAPIDVGDPNKVAQEVPAGKWAGTLTINNRISNNGAPQLVIDAVCEEALSPENEGNVGFRVRTYITFKPSTDQYAHMPKLEVKQMSDAFDVEMPDYTPLADENLTTGERFAGFTAWVDAIESTQREFWTFSDKKDGSPKLAWFEKGQKLGRVTDEEEAPPPPAAKAKTNGAAHKTAKPGGGKASKPAARAQARR